jgi:hypothetical protein
MPQMMVPPMMQPYQQMFPGQPASGEKGADGTTSAIGQPAALTLEQQ